jgi:hypothetical protein
MCLTCYDLNKRLDRGEGTYAQRCEWINAVNQCRNEVVLPYRNPSIEALDAMEQLDKQLGLTPCLD